VTLCLTTVGFEQDAARIARHLVETKAAPELLAFPASFADEAHARWVAEGSARPATQG